MISYFRSALERRPRGRVLERKPGALRNGAPFKDRNLPGSMTRLPERLAKHTDGDRQFVDILSMVALTVLRP